MGGWGGREKDEFLKLSVVWLGFRWGKRIHLEIMQKKRAN